MVTEPSHLQETKRRKSTAVDASKQAPTVRLVFEGSTGPVTREPIFIEDGATTMGRADGDARSVVLDDEHASRQHARIDSSAKRSGSARLVDLGSANGTFVNGCPISEVELHDGDLIRVGDSLLVFRLDEEHPDAAIESLKGQSPSMRNLRSCVDLVARSATTVILLGQTGTGKEVVAMAIHQLSGRSGPFVAVNCGAIPESLAESQLFGHCAGSFTGAKTDRVGHFVAADGGTLFLDELGDLPAAIQTKLLRVLETRRVLPLGSSQELPFDARIVCAAESNLERDIDASGFRAALYARLAGLTIGLPPLKTRREDILLLMHFLHNENARITPQLAESLLLHDWPYNVRELVKVAEELQLRSKGRDVLTLEMMRHRLRAVALDDSPEEQRPSSPVFATPPTKEQLAALAQAHDGNVARMAQACGRSRRQVYRWFAQHDIRLEHFRPGG